MGVKSSVLLRGVVKNTKNEVSPFRFFMSSNILHREGSENASLIKERGFQLLRTHVRTLRFTRAPARQSVVFTESDKPIETIYNIFRGPGAPTGVFYYSYF